MKAVRRGALSAALFVMICLIVAPSLAQQAPASPSPAVMQPAAPAITTATPLDAAPVSRSLPPSLHDLSPWSMFMGADIVVQGVMVGLAFASVVTWSVAIAKLLEVMFAKSRLQAGLKRMAESRTLAEAQVAVGEKRNVLAMLLAAAMREARLSAGLASDAGIKERAASAFSEIQRAEARIIRRGMGALATIGATSPFVGLFGTVWGIMNSFIGISKSQTTNLAVVAPGIAEALLATAIGLVAAIPAVIIYNHFSRVTRGYLELVARGAGAAGRLLSRDLDRTHHGMHSRAAE